MKWSVEFDAAGAFVRVTTGGSFSPADHARMVEEILGQPYWTPGMNALFDHRGLDLSVGGYAAMIEASETHLRNDSRIGEGKAAMVAGSAADFGSARQFEMLAERYSGTRMHVFLDLADAEAWLRDEGAE